MAAVELHGASVYGALLIQQATAADARTYLGVAAAGASIPASQVSAGTFGAGNFTFPNDLTVNGAHSFRGLMTSWPSATTNPRTNWPSVVSAARFALATSGDDALAFVRGDNGDTSGATIRLLRTGNVDPGILALVAQFDTLGGIQFSGAVSSSAIGTGAGISATVEGVPSGSAIPTALHFSTTGSSLSTTRRVTLSEAGHFHPATTPASGNLYDLGLSTTPWRTGYFGTSVGIGFTGSVSSTFNLDVVSKFGVRPSTTEQYPTAFAGGIAASFHIMQNASSVFGWALTRVGNHGFGPSIEYYKTRSTTGSPTAVADGDTVGTFGFQAASSGSIIRRSAAITAIVNGAVSSGTVPIDLVIQLSPTADTLNNAGIVWRFLSSGTFRPESNNAVGIGTSALRLSSLFTVNLDASGNTTLGDAAGDTLTIAPSAVTWSNNPTHSGNHTFSGNVVVNGNVTLGDATSDTLSITARLATGFNPSADNVRELGTALLRFANIYATTFTGALAGNATTASAWQTARTLTIGATGKSVNGSANVTWSLAEIGATTVGGNLFGLTNPSAVTFLRVNADNSVSALDAATFRSAIGAGTGSGDVVGPASAADNAIVRFDGTTGKLVQNSGVTIDDSGNVLMGGATAINDPGLARFLLLRTATISDNGRGIEFSTLDGTYNPRAYIYHTGTPSSQRVTFDSSFSSGTGAATWYFASGRVGVAASSPSSRLHVDGDSGLIVGDVAATASQVNLGIGLLTGGRPFIGTNTSTNILEFGTRAAVAIYFVTNSTTWAQLDASGNFGIGATPAEKLDVGGAIRAGGNGSVNGSVLLRDDYSNGSVTVLGTLFSSGGPFLGYGVKPTTGSGTIVSSTGVAVSRGWYQIAGMDHSWYRAPSQTTSIGSAVSSPTLMMQLTSTNLNFYGSNLDVPSGSITIGASSAGTRFTVINGDAVNAQQLWMYMSGTDAIINATRFSGTQPTLQFQIDNTTRLTLSSTQFASNLAIRVQKIGASLISDDTISGTDASMNTYVSFQRSGVEKGWVGFGDGSSGLMRVRNSIGDLRLDSASDVLVHADGALRGTFNSDGLYLVNTYYAFNTTSGSYSPIAGSTSQYNIFYKRNGTIGLYLGDGSDPYNYYDSPRHYFRDNTPTNVAIIENGAATFYGNLFLTTGANRYVQIGSASSYFYRLQSTGDDFQIIEANDVAVRMHIDYPNGYVGFGTTGPTEKVHVEGGNLLVKNGTSDVAVYIGNSGYGVSLTYATGTLLLRTNSTTRLSIDNSGVVTIANLAGSGTRVVTVDASGTLSSGTAGTGDVTGPASSTDNGIPRFSGTGGKTLVNSSVTIDASNNLTTTARVRAAELSLSSTGNSSEKFSGQTTVSTSATTIAALGAAWHYCVVMGSGVNGAFCDIVVSATGATPVVISSTTLSGSPAARTYTMSSANLRLTMGSSSYDIGVRTTSLVV